MRALLFVGILAIAAGVLDHMDLVGDDLNHGYSKREVHRFESLLDRVRKETHTTRRADVLAEVWNIKPEEVDKQINLWGER